MPKLIIDDQEIEVPEGMTVLQAAEMLGIEIPVFCYHPKLSIAGNCRMCLVEQEGVPKPIASCAMPACDGMVIKTHSPMTQKARKGNLELLLINHPLDCPICDQGGECDLQDITVAYGGDGSRFEFNKRAVPQKDFGPLIATAMNRCIQCTRCIRFATEIAGASEIGALGRGEMMEIGTYVQQAIKSELSGNLIDICPVGALMSKPYSYKGRSWELSKTPSVDVFDAVGSSIRIDSRGTEVMRILPRQNDDINEEWLSDKSRFAYDGLKYQRLDRPYIRGKDGRLQPATWDEAFHTIADRLQNIPGDRMAAVVGDLVDVESMMALKDLMTSMGSPHLDCRQYGEEIEASPRCSYLFNTTIAGIEQADFCLLIGTNPRWEAPLINARIRKAYLNSDLSVASIGPLYDQGYPVQDLGNDPFILEKIISGKHLICSTLKEAENPMLILGQGPLRRKDGAAILHYARKVAEKYGFIHKTNLKSREHWNGFNVLQTAASRVGALDIGFVPGSKGYSLKKMQEAALKKKLEVVYLLGADEIDLKPFQSAFVIYQGHHGDRGASVADVILPGASYTEKSGTYVNTEGRVQRSLQAVEPPGEAKEDWKIIRALSERLGLKLPYNTIQEIHRRLVELNPLFDEVDQIQRAAWVDFGHEGKLSSELFEPIVNNFYMTDSITRHSPTMAKCTQAILEGKAA